MGRPFVLSEITRFHRMGIDQTENLYGYFGVGEDKVVDLAKIDTMKKRVYGGEFYLSERGNEYLVIEMFNGGHVYKVNKNDYLLTVNQGDLVVTDMNTDDEFSLIEDSKLNWRDMKYLGKDNYTMMSSEGKRGFKGYPAVRFDNKYDRSLRIHVVIVLMDQGIEVVEGCVGFFRSHEIHHLSPFIKSQDNSVTNLQVLRKSDHERIHGYYRGA